MLDTARCLYNDGGGGSDGIIVCQQMEKRLATNYLLPNDGNPFNMATLQLICAKEMDLFGLVVSEVFAS